MARVNGLLEAPVLMTGQLRPRKPRSSRFRRGRECPSSYLSRRRCPDRAFARRHGVVFAGLSHGRGRKCPIPRKVGHSGRASRARGTTGAHRGDEAHPPDRSRRVAIWYSALALGRLCYHHRVGLKDEGAATFRWLATTTGRVRATEGEVAARKNIPAAPVGEDIPPALGAAPRPM